MRGPGSPCGMVLCAAVTLLIVPLGLIGCGTERDSAPAGAPAERAFLAAMIEHHVAAIEMARLAQGRADAPVIVRLAGALIEFQEREILQMDAIHRRLFDAEVGPDAGAPAQLGLTAREAALWETEPLMALERARLFDLAFVDRMVAHHRGAIAMAEAALQLGADSELRLLAETILTEREAQVREMMDFRADRYGLPTSTAGAGPPARTTEAPS